MYGAISDFYFEYFSVFYTQTNLISLSDMQLMFHRSFTTLEFNLKCKQNITFEWGWGKIEISNKEKWTNIIYVQSFSCYA